MKKSLDDQKKTSKNTIKNIVSSQSSSSQVLVLLSGGLDSLACLNYYLDRNYSTIALFVDYNQASRKQESKAVKKICGHYKIPLITVDIKGINKTENGYIQGRNAFLLYTALLKFNLPKGIISIGIHASSDYSDCSKFFISRIQETFDIYTQGRIRIDAPFVNWSKGEIWQYSKDNNIPVDLAYSCELGLKQPCGICLSCIDLEALNAC